MQGLTEQEQMIYDTMKVHNWDRSVSEITGMVKRRYQCGWSKKTVKASLEEMIKKGYVVKKRTAFIWYYKLANKSGPAQRTEKRGVTGSLTAGL